MWVLKSIGEYLFGIFTLILTVPFILIGLVISLFELPRYLRIRSM